jgi:phenylalanyl-tRNA synthetase alpha subunit
MITQLLCTDIEDALTSLCTHFAEELQRQNLVLSVCTDQGIAARAHDIDQMNEKTRTLIELMDTALEHEKERLDLLKKVVSYYQLSEENHTLSELIKVVPMPWKSHMRQFQSSIQKVLKQTQDTVQKNETYMRNASEKIDTSIKKTLEKNVSNEPSYSSNGNLEQNTEHSAPTMLNAVG